LDSKDQSSSRGSDDIVTILDSESVESHSSEGLTIGAGSGEDVSSSKGIGREGSGRKAGSNNGGLSREGLAREDGRLARKGLIRETSGLTREMLIGEDGRLTDLGNRLTNSGRKGLTNGLLGELRLLGMDIRELRLSETGGRGKDGRVLGLSGKGTRA
jgi:hypothetical protein